MRIIIIFLITLWNVSTSFSLIATILPSNNILDENEIQYKIKNIITQDNISNTEKENIVKQLTSALQSISETRYSEKKIEEYQNIINNFSSIIHQLHEEKNIESHSKNNKNNINISDSNKLRQYLLHINQQLTNLDQELQQEQNLLRSINDSLISLPQQHTKIKKELNDIHQKISNFSTTMSYLEQAKIIALQAIKESKQTKITEIELAQISANNRQELSKLRIELLKNKYERLDNELQMTHIQLHKMRQQETAHTIEEIETLIKTTEKIGIYSINIAQQLTINRHLSQSLKEQIEHINLITLQQRQTASHILQARQTLAKLLEQSQWIDRSPALGETLRSQIFKLSKKNTHQTQQLNHEMNKLKKNHLEYEKQIYKLSVISSQNIKNNEILSPNQIHILKTQTDTQKKLLNSLLSNCDIQILELTKLKIAHEQLKDIIKNIECAAHNYLFWIPDIHPINLSYLYKTYHDLHLLLNSNTLFQLTSAIKKSFINNQKSSILSLTLLLFICSSHITCQNKYYSFLKHSNQQLKYTNNFLLTLQNIFWSIIIAIPIPILLMLFGYNLYQSWEYPIASAIGEGIITAAPILWLLMIFSYFTSQNGLFISHFKWKKNKIKQALYHPTFFIIAITTLLVTISTCNNYNNKELYDTLSRLFFTILCICLTLITYRLKQANFPLYTDKHTSPNNIINQYLWYIMTYFPIISATAACFGYLSTAQTLLLQLETSLIIGIISSIIYYTTHRWIIIQKYKILSKRVKQTKHIINTKKHNISLLPKSYTKTNNTINIPTAHSIIKKNIHDLSNNDLYHISNQSLQLIRLTINFITIVIILSLWSELHYIYVFLEKTTILDTITSIIVNTNNIQPITIKKLLTITLICFFTIKFTKYLPSLLILTILQYLNFTPGTNYAIIILTKHTLILFSIIISCSHLEIEWSKLQWLIAAIGVGLGFGLQEIFANFISGLIILFEKPIRIEDTITIENLTGHVTQINTRATTITDWDHKDIIIPNKEFITKKFINWSLSDTITRIALKIPGPPEINTATITHIILEAVKSCPLVLHIPQPEVYLINLEQGIPLFEIRIYTSNIKHRMTVRHQVHILIIHFYKKHGLQIPFPHIKHINTNEHNT
ncbi:miniconductance mechanosensitive channel MscM [Blochmannia endosymbiont of Polyrhachis (Hedomyrma) turneri]|uniref:miniconductance mechanosensitive channel MscM n=1 Tax=Blochmannia endosymbiont of Polyrhachis (Hedomyrma) turneri TaxID=1505596 RepID=UPI00061A62EC|nr:miniconductance mechanosensitive channel MscM [Blochmannia endosymbiont of Polyrhachis (Hedomyrma) turneri]AKC59661.1 putative MscS family protein YjeP [Blochmannia endosymbiont of Polyrhachis (Hedomyrma) turneri]